MSLAQIAIPNPLSQLFTYRVPEALKEKVKPGMRVLVPFRNKKVIGFCLGFTAQPPTGFSESGLKEIIEAKDPLPVFSEKMVDLIVWLSDYYMAPIGKVAAAALPTRLTQLKAAATAKPRTKEESHAHFHQPEILQLNGEQKNALDQILDIFSARSTQYAVRSTVLLHGITGSGKTEIYLQFLTKIIAQGQQGILLVPEIGLTPQLIGRVQGRLGQEIAVYHSGLTEAQRHLYWEKMRRGELSVAVGTRSALFAPFPNLGAIIIDEEHDSSYKQGDGGFYYNARDAAIVRAKLEKAVVVLGSATPSLETFHNAKKGKYHYIYLSKRATGAKLPDITLIDLRKEKFAQGSKTLSPTLKEAIGENLYRGEQTLLFLNRRGFANFLLCEDCGKTLECPNCSITLTYHKNPPSMVCHYCEYKARVPNLCNHCQSPALKPLGQGTQSLEEELRVLFPEAKIVRLDSDTTVKREDRNRALHQMKKGEVDILLGTQMVAKGHDFPNVTLVGVILADTALHLPDFRASERTFQLLTQVAGRSGRAEKPGRVLIQTFQPEHFSLECARGHDFDLFSKNELEQREALCYPPFSRLAQIRFSGKNSQGVEAAANQLKKFLLRRSGEGIKILGPAPASVTKVRNLYRWLMLIKAPNSQTLKGMLKQAALQNLELPSSIQATIDIDPLQMM